MKAIIKKTELKRINAVWKKHKPQGLGFSDTDMIIVSFKTNGNKTFTNNFYCRLKGDGTIGCSITKASEKRQENLRDFIRKYISKDKKYDVRENIKGWEGKKVEVEELGEGYVIKI